MRNRHPAGQRINPYLARAGDTLARSPSERLEPSRPPARPHRRNHNNRDPRRGRPLLRFVNGLLTLTLVLMILAGAAAYVFDSQLDAPGPLQQAKSIVIPKNEGTLEIAARLEREGIVTDRRLFIVGYRWMQLAAMVEGTKPVPLKAGDYAVRPNASVRQLIELLSEGRTLTYRVKIPEGLTSYQIVERLKADPNLSGDIEAVPPEGSLLPETFVVERGMARQAVVDRMQAEAHKMLEKAWAHRKNDSPIKSAEQAVVLASIVEKETGRGDERDRVAAVFLNRLRQNMRLQSDPTILYGLTGGKTVWSRPIQKNEITQKTSHNTYQIDGLPPTPICNPGRAAVEAVLNPAETKALYFVADGSGGHVFSETLRDHNANVQKWRATEKELKAKAVTPTANTATPTTPTSPAARARAVVRTQPPAKAAPADAAPEAPDAKPKR
jgi:UPF0755 protein